MDFSAWAVKEYGLLGFAAVSFVGLVFLFVQHVLPEMLKKKPDKPAENSGGGALQKIGEKAVDKYISEDQQETKKIMASMVEILARIEGELSEARKEREFSLNQTIERFATVTETIQNMKKTLNKVTEKSAIGIVYNLTARPLDRMMCLNEYLQLGKDGSCLDFAVEDFIRHDPDSWHSIVNMANDNAIENEDAYKKSLNKIDEKLEKLKGKGK